MQPARPVRKPFQPNAAVVGEPLSLQSRRSPASSCWRSWSEGFRNRRCEQRRRDRAVLRAPSSIKTGTCPRVPGRAVGNDLRGTIDISPSPPANGNVSAVARHRPTDSTQPASESCDRGQPGYTKATLLSPTVPLGPHRIFRGRVSHLIGAARYLRLRHWSPATTAASAGSRHTARSSQKCYRTVAQLAHDQLTYTDQ